MAVNRANIVDQNFTDTITSFVEGAAQPDPNQPVRPGFRLTGRQAVRLYSRPWYRAGTLTSRVAF